MAVGPVRDAAPGELPRRRRGARGLVLGVHPFQLARNRVERDHGAPRAAGGVERAVRHQRRAFELELGARAEEVGLEAPRDLERVEVGRVDLIERRIVMVAEIAGIRSPFAAGRRRLLRAADAADPRRRRAYYRRRHETLRLRSHDEGF